MTSTKTLANLVRQSSGKMLTVTFLKKDGTERVLNGRLGVKKYLKGTGLNQMTTDSIVVYDVQNKGYRTINSDSILAVRLNGIEAVAVK